MTSPISRRDFVNLVGRTGGAAAVYGAPCSKPLRAGGRVWTIRSGDTIVETGFVQHVVWDRNPHRAFDLEVLRCPRCAGRMELIATIDDPAVIHRIFAHLGFPGARDGPESTVALSRPRDDQPALPFALPSC